MPRTVPPISMAACMGETYGLRKLGGDKVALLGLFVLALLAARFVVGLKSAISLSEPVSLPGEGISVCVPSGNGWYNEKQWALVENSFALRSVFALPSGKPTAQVSCRYLLAAEPAAPGAQFERKAREVNGAVIIKTGQVQAATLTIDWAHIQQPDILLDIFFGIAKLPNGCQFDIEVRQTTGGADLAARIFQSIVGSLNFDKSSGNPAAPGGRSRNVVSDFPQHTRRFVQSLQNWNRTCTQKESI